MLTLLRISKLGGGNPTSLTHVFLQDAVSAVGGVIGAMHIPEKWFPGSVDIYLNSHNIMHVLVVVAVYSMHQVSHGHVGAVMHHPPYPVPPLPKPFIDSSRIPGLCVGVLQFHLDVPVLAKNVMEIRSIRSQFSPSIRDFQGFHGFNKKARPVTEQRSVHALITNFQLKKATTSKD
uniref:Progestin and adipoQ receptor family member 4 n=1 Tax=Anopheles maculatus TaxID=74869 RepID=A0A182TB07_9DIPT